MIGVVRQSSLTPMSVHGAAAEVFAQIVWRRILWCRPRALSHIHTKAGIADYGRRLMLNCQGEPDCRR
jgi:hypothetical protein